jgi:hypothetical protein
LEFTFNITSLRASVFSSLVNTGPSLLELEVALFVAFGCRGELVQFNFKPRKTAFIGLLLAGD